MQRFSTQVANRTSTDARFSSCLQKGVLTQASDEAPLINASCITIDGGRSVMYHD